MRRLLTALLVVGASVVSAAQPSLPPPFPRVNAERLLETDRIVVWRIVWPKGAPTALHRHVYDQVGTYYARGGRTITTPDGNARQAMTEVGSLSATRKGTTHIEEGTTDPPLRAIFIELKHDGPSGLASPGSDAELFSRPGATQLRDDERVRVSDYTAGASADRESRARHDTLVVYLGNGRVRWESDRASAFKDVEPGSYHYVPGGTREREIVLEGRPRAVAFEIK
jgi:hypothetical protein